MGVTNAFLSTHIGSMKARAQQQDSPALDSERQLCSDLDPRQLCFCVREYDEGVFSTLIHKHVPAYRISQNRVHEALRSLVARYSKWPGDWILHSLLNDRGSKPERYPGFRHDTSYPEPGVLRHTVSGTRVHARCDRIVSVETFRPASTVHSAKAKE